MAVSRHMSILWFSTVFVPLHDCYKRWGAAIELNENASANSMKTLLRLAILKMEATPLNSRRYDRRTL
jgi:hypothetical protein